MIGLLPRLDNSAILLLAWCAARDYGGKDEQAGMFNSANFATVVHGVFGLPTPDGVIVKLILSGRYGIEQVGNSYWRLTS